MKRLFLFVILITSLAACKKSEVKAVDWHYDYYDLTPGRYIIYDVIEISHSQGASGSDTNVYQLKTVIGDTITDNEGRIAREFLRYKRINASENWVLTDLWTTIIADYKAELVEENQRVVKMVFVPTINKSWDANANNTLGELECYYDELHNSYTVGSQVFDSTLIVEQADDLNLIRYERKYEVYANGIGLIKKHYRDLNINNFNIEDINDGQELFMEIVSYGIE